MWPLASTKEYQKFYKQIASADGGPLQDRRKALQA